MQVLPEIVNLLERGRADGARFFLPEGQLERKTYEAVNKVLDALGGRWSRRDRAHLFDRDVEGAIEDVILTGTAVNRKQTLGFFETPDGLADELALTAQIAPEARVLEPSAGKGALIRAVRKFSPTADIAAVELDLGHCSVLGAMGEVAFCGDFLSLRPDPNFDRVVMNPPFRKQADIDHVLQAWRWLRPGGRLVSVMSAAVTFRENRKTAEFREFVAVHGRVRDVPAGMFRASGTDVNTCYVVLDKPK